MPKETVASLPLITGIDTCDISEDPHSDVSASMTRGRGRKNPETTARTTRNLELGSYLDSGSTWDVFKLDHTRVIKLTAPSTFNLSQTQSDPTESQASESEARRNILQEDRLYRTNLVPLIGQIVPRYYGLYGSLAKQPSGNTAEVWAMILENAGEEVVIEDLSTADK